MSDLHKLEDEYLAASDVAYEARLAHMSACRKLSGAYIPATPSAREAEFARKQEANFDAAKKNEQIAWERLISEYRKLGVC